MTNFTVIFTEVFNRELDKLSPADQQKVMKKIAVLEENPHYPSLRSKKLQGRPGLFECSVNMDIRIVWYYENGRIIVLLDVGHHDILKKY